jgi:hypothetical protein
MQLNRGASGDRSHLTDPVTARPGARDGSGVGGPRTPDMTVLMPPEMSNLSHVKQSRRTRGAAEGVHSRPGQELVLHYTDLHGRAARIFAPVFYGGFTAVGLLMIFGGLKVAEAVPGCWPLLAWWFGWGSVSVLMFGPLTVRAAVVGRRSGCGDWWLRLSSTGFEVNDRLGKPRRYEWREIDKFMLVESQPAVEDVPAAEWPIIKHVGFRYSPGRRRTLANKLCLIKGRPPDRDGTKADGLIMGYWDRPLDEAVDLLNEWLARNTAA